MDAHYRPHGGLLGMLTVTVHAETVKDLFRLVAQVQEVFGADAACGVCGGQKLSFRVRVVDDFEFYELACSCGAVLQYGQHKNGGTLFPKRQAGEPGRRGWLVSVVSRRDD